MDPAQFRKIAAMDHRRRKAAPAMDPSLYSRTITMDLHRNTNRTTAMQGGPLTTRDQTNRTGYSQTCCPGRLEATRTDGQNRMTRTKRNTTRPHQAEGGPPYRHRDSRTPSNRLQCCQQNNLNETRIRSLQNTQGDLRQVQTTYTGHRQSNIQESTNKPTNLCNHTDLLRSLPYLHLQGGAPSKDLQTF